MKEKRFLVYSLVLLACLLAVGFLYPPNANAQKESVTFRLEWSPDGYHGPYYAALKKGYFAEQGLEVTILLGKGSGSTVQLVGAGENPIGNASYSVLAQAVDKEVPVKAVFGIYQKNPLGIVTFQDLGVKTPKDLI